MFASKEEQKDPHDTFLVKTISKAFPVSKQFVGEKFFVTVEGKHMLTPLFVVLLSIEFSCCLYIQHFCYLGFKATVFCH